MNWIHRTCHTNKTYLQHVHTWEYSSLSTFTFFSPDTHNLNQDLSVSKVMDRLKTSFKLVQFQVKKKALTVKL